jgi:uncharacterized protein (AIM24 family)
MTNTSGSHTPKQVPIGPSHPSFCRRPSRTEPRQIDVEPGSWIYRDESVRMDPHVYGLRNGMFGGTGNLVFNRFTGPGPVGIQSLYMDMSARLGVSVTRRAVH